MPQLPDLVARRWSEAKAELESSVRSGSRPGAGVDVDAILENIAALIRSAGREELQELVRSSGATPRPAPRLQPAVTMDIAPAGDPLVTSDLPSAGNPLVTSDLPSAANPLMTTDLPSAPGGAAVTTIGGANGDPGQTTDLPAPKKADRLAVTGDYDGTDAGSGGGAGVGGKTPTLDHTGAYTPESAAAGESHADTKPSKKPGRKIPVVPGYEIEGVLGRGGMGVVYKARQVGLRRTVALKMILSGEHAAAGQLARFEAEARAIALIRHPNIVQIYEIGEHDGLPYFSLEFCPGGSLDRRLKHEPQPPRQAAALAEQMARAMAAAHEAGVVHRDLKPGNVLLDEAGVPKITDFGLARELDDAEGQTRTGSILGTPSYMAPEQAMGKTKEVGPAADQYSLGATLYELLTGRPPFQGANVMETLEQVRAREPVPPTQLAPGCPLDLETICLKALQKEPAKRYPSCEAFADDLKAFLDGRPITARPIGAAEKAWRWAKRNPRVAGLAGLVAALLVLLAAGGATAAVVFDRKKKEAEGLAEERRLAKEDADWKKVEAEQARDEKDTALKAETKALSEKAIALAEEEKARRASDESYALTRATLYTALDEIPVAMANAVFARGAEQLVLEAIGAMLEKQHGLALSRGLPDRAVYDFHVRMGDLLLRRGKVADADKQFRAALAITDRLLKTEKEKDRAKGNHALVLRRLGNLNRDTRRDGAADALNFYAAATKLQREVLDRPETGEIPPAEAKASLAGTLLDAADLYRRAGLFDRALPPCEEGLKLWEEVVKTPGTAYTASAPGFLAEGYVLYGRILTRLGKDAEAEKALAEGLARYRALLKANPTNPTLQTLTARAARELGDFLLMRGRLDDAVAPHDLDRELTAGLLQSPEIILAQQELADVYYRSATLALKKGEKETAAKLYRKCLDLRLVVAEARPNDPRQPIRVANAQARCGIHAEASAAMEAMAAKFKDDPFAVRQAAFNIALCAGAVSDSRPDGELTDDEIALRDRYADRALTLLEDLVGRLGFRDVVQLKTDPDLDAIRDHPRFQALVKKLEAAATKKP